MFLSAIAQKAMHERFVGYDEDSKEFSDLVITGRLGPVDRFLSIYNQPTRMRGLFLRPGTTLPASRIVKHEASNRIYLLGVERMDAKWDEAGGDPYVSVISAHDVSESVLGYGGVCTITRRVPLGPQDNPGWLVETEVCQTYSDLQHYSSAKEPQVFDHKTSTFVAWFSSAITLMAHDKVQVGPTSYRVQETFSDMGMLGARLTRDPDPRMDVQVVRVTREYNENTYDYHTTRQVFNVTVAVPLVEDTALWGDRESSVTLSIQAEHIGFPPEVDMEVIFQGVSRRVSQVINPAGDSQYKVVCGK